MISPKPTLRLTVDRMDESREMVWSGGPLATLMNRLVPDMTDSFEQFGDAVVAAARA